MERFPITVQIALAATFINEMCPNIHKKEDPYPTARLAKFTEDEIVYEITEGKAGRGNVASV